MNTKIFKAYDIRGIYPQEINEEAAYKIGVAFATFTKNNSNKENPQIVVGRDNRLSSDSLFDSLSRGIIDQGANVINIGLSATPTFYFAVANYKYDGGINITASHNPKQYNGFKMVKAGAVPLSEISGIGEIKDLVMVDNFPIVPKKGEIVEKTVLIDYILANKEKEPFNIKMIVDTANSVSGVFVPKIFDQINFTHIFSDLNGDFPNHEPDPLKKENINKLQEKVIKDKADLGIAFDGDGDRVFFIDEKGEVVSSDMILALIASIIIKEKPGSKILYDLRCSNIVKEVIEGLKGEAIISRVGHSFIKALMREQDIIFGAEYSGHYYLKQGEDYYESPYFVIFTILKEMKRTGNKLSELIEPFRKYYHSGEINFKVENKEEIIERVKNKYINGNLLIIDGVRIDFDDWWFSIRSSNTEPILRLIVEGKTKEKMEEKLKEIEAIIQS
ncbi:MAG: phosphomannomutase/phosphoglucomutase [Candidatus Paceibacterota bacterium]|jgi:phosphomannomutase